MTALALVVVPLLLVLLFYGAVTLRTRLRSGRVRADGGFGTGTGAETGVDVAEKKSTLYRWFTTVDHKDIGVMYLLFATFAGVWGGVDAMMIRFELLSPPADVWAEETYNALFTTHGLTMLFFFVTPAFFGFTNYVLPLKIGADDLAFPRLNAIGFWMLPPSLLLVRAGLLTEVLGKFLALLVDPAQIGFLFAMAPPPTGWTMYTPLSTSLANPQIDFTLLGLHMSGIATTMTAINFIVTIFIERAEDVDLGELDIFVWSMLTTAGIILFAFSLLGAAIVMLLLDRNFGTTFYAVSGGGPLLWQHLFWFFGHPEVYIIFLPATGLVSTILPKFAGRKIFGFDFIVYSTLAIGVLSFGVWAHHMFTTGTDPRLLASFMIVTIAIAVPSAIKTFNWLTTLWKGSVRLTAPMILCVGGIGTFIVGGITGVFLSSIPIDQLYQDTYYVVGHFHLILMGIIPFMIFAAGYFWFPLLTDRMYNQRLARLQSTLLVFGSTLTFSVLVVLGMMGMPRRYANYPEQFVALQRVASFGAFVIGTSVLLWLYVVFSGWRSGPRVRGADVWNLKDTYQFTREWQWFEDHLEEEYGVTPAEPTSRQRRPPESEKTPRQGSPTAFEDLANIARDAVVGAAGGLAGVALLTGVLWVGSLFGFFEFQRFTGLSRLIALGEYGWPPGYLALVAGGMTAWALVFVTIADYLPGKPRFRTGIVFAMVLVPGFVVGFYEGGSGLQFAGYVLTAVLAHAAYGAALGAAFELATDYVETSI